MTNFLHLFLVLPILFFPTQGKVKSEIAFCNLEVNNTIKQAKADFNVIYLFEIDTEGKPVNINKIQDKYIGKEKVVECLSEWRFEGLPTDVKLTVIFRWEHGKGWTKLSVVGKEFSYVVKVKEGFGY